MTKPKSVHIPLSPLGAKLAEAEAIKREMTTLFRELEEQVTGRPVTIPGAWRHHPTDWAKQADEKGKR